MGKVKRVLSKRDVSNIPNYVGVELCETVHFHMPGFRFELTLPQLLKFCKIVCDAKNKWVDKSCPPTETDQFILLSDGYLPDTPVYYNRFEIEEQTIPSVHLHIRNLSLRFTVEEFKVFAESIWEARKSLEHS